MPYHKWFNLSHLECYTEHDHVWNIRYMLCIYAFIKNDKSQKMSIKIWIIKTINVFKTTIFKIMFLIDYDVGTHGHHNVDFLVQPESSYVFHKSSSYVFFYKSIMSVHMVFSQRFIKRYKCQRFIERFNL